MVGQRNVKRKRSCSDEVSRLHSLSLSLRILGTNNSRGYILAPSVLPIFPFWSVRNSAAGIFRQTCHTSSHQNFATPLPTPESQSHSQLAMSEAGLFLGRYRYPQSQAQAQQQLQKNFDALFFPFLPAPVAAACHGTDADGHCFPGLVPSLYLAEKRRHKPPIQPPFVSHKRGKLSALIPDLSRGRPVVVAGHTHSRSLGSYTTRAAVVPRPNLSTQVFLSST